MRDATHLLQTAAAGAADPSGGDMHGRIVGLIREYVKGQSETHLRAMLRELSAISPARLRAIIGGVESGAATMSAEAREDLTALLLNLARGAGRIIRAAGGADTRLRASRAIELLLGDLRPTRRAGEAVGVGRDEVLEKFLGQGSLGEVWLGRDLRRPDLPPLAFKIFTRAGSADWLHRVKTDESLAQSMEHQPHVVETIERVSDARPHPFIAMEYLAGGSLEDWLLEEPLNRPILRKQEIIRGVAAGLATAHRHGIYHGDLKPSQILLTGGPDVQAKIGDLDLAASNSNDAAPADATAPRLRPLAEGSLALPREARSIYSPPEAGQPWADHVPVLSDVFAVGVLWYQLLVERIESPPYDFVDVLRSAGHDTHAIGLIARCLAGAERRFKDAGELEEALSEQNFPDWPPLPPGCFDVSRIVREYLSIAGR